MTSAMDHRSLRGLGAVAALLCFSAAPVAAQGRSVEASPRVPAESYGYRHEALGIAPVWNGLAVVRGAERARVANLGFFWPSRIDAAFAGDSAQYAASRALGTRRVAAVLTDAGALLMVAAVARGRFGDRTTRDIALAGAGAFVLSVPLHFSADDWLARAVWWHNAELTR